MVEALLARGAPTDSVDVGEGGAGGKGAVARVMLISTAAASATYRLRVCVGGSLLLGFVLCSKLSRKSVGRSKMHAHATTDVTAQKTKGTRTWNIGDCVAASYLVMHLFSQERLKSRCITAAVYGNFFAPKQQELVLGGPRAAAKCSRAHKAR